MFTTTYSHDFCAPKMDLYAPSKVRNYAGLEQKYANTTKANPYATEMKGERAAHASAHESPLAEPMEPLAMQESSMAGASMQKPQQQQLPTMQENAANSEVNSVANTRFVGKTGMPYENEAWSAGGDWKSAYMDRTLQQRQPTDVRKQKSVQFLDKEMAGNESLVEKNAANEYEMREEEPKGTPEEQVGNEKNTLNEIEQEEATQQVQEDASCSNPEPPKRESTVPPSARDQDVYNKLFKYRQQEYMENRQRMFKSHNFLCGPLH